MPKRYGITSNPGRREKELRNEFYGVEKFKIEEKFSTQSQAQNWENKKPNQHPGGPKVPGPFYGYSHSYSRRKSTK